MSESELALLSQPAVIAGLVLVAVIEVSLMLWAVFDWAKRPPEQIRGNRILWLLLILLVNIAGPIIYLTVGRLPAPAQDLSAGDAGARSHAAMDSLYGSGKDDSST